MNFETEKLLDNTHLTGLIFETSAVLNSVTDHGKMLPTRLQRIHAQVNKLASSACCRPHERISPPMSLLEALAGALKANPDDTLVQLLDSLACASVSATFDAGTQAASYMELDAAFAFFEKEYLALEN